MDQVTTAPDPQKDSMLLKVREIGPTFGAEVTGMPIRGDANPALVKQFIALLHRYRILLVPEIQLHPADMVAFSKLFGPLEIHSRYDNTLPDHREIFCVGNVERDGMKASFNRGVEQWHADSSYREVPSDASMFYGEIVPPEGAETMFADATAAWLTLDRALQQRVENLYAVHSLEALRLWGQRHTPEHKQAVKTQITEYPPVRQPLVRTHPTTGMKSLYVCPAVISHIEGMDASTGTALLETLIQHITQPHYVYSHRWRQGDLVVWDNRAVLHTASLFDHTRYQRLMYRTTVAGNAPPLSA